MPCIHKRVMERPEGMPGRDVIIDELSDPLAWFDEITTFSTDNVRVRLGSEPIEPHRINPR